MNFSNKRRRNFNKNDCIQPQLSWLPTSTSEAESQLDKALAGLYIEGHEADIIHGKENIALMLEPPDPGVDSPQRGEKGSGLVKWSNEDGTGDVCWVDRYDARLLLSPSALEPLRGAQSSRAERPPSPSGWSDLPSDVEDTFFFTPTEVEELQRSKRRRLLDDAQEARLRALRERDGPDAEDDFGNAEDVWGGSDEEPEAQQLELMRRTATHIMASPNPVQLEARILANHGSDERFAFLKGRWRKRWSEIRQKVKEEKEHEAEEARRPQTATSSGLAGLGSYGDSDEESEPEQKSSADAVSEKDKLAARRARAREWAAKRRAEKAREVEG